MAETPRESPSFFGWLALASGLLSFMISWPQLGPLWVVLLLGTWAGRRLPSIPTQFLAGGALLALLPTLLVWKSTQDPIGSLGTFLSIAMLLVLAGARTANEHRVPYLLSFILLMAVGHKTLEIFYVLPIVGLFLGYALEKLEQRFRAHPDALPAQNPRLRTALGMMVFSALLAVPIFWIMPRTRLSVMAVAGQPALSGFSGQIQFGAMGPMKLSDRLVMKVRTKATGLYTGVILDQYNRSGWTTTLKGTRVRSSTGNPLLTLDPKQVGPNRAINTSRETRDAEGRPTVQEGSRIFVQDFLLEPLNEPAIFSTGEPLAVWSPGQSIVATSGGSLIRLDHRRRNEKVSYRIYAAPTSYTPEALDQADLSTTQKGLWRRYTQLPEDFPERVKAKAREVTQGATTRAQKIEALSQFLQNFRYSLERRVNPSLDPVEDLLFGDPQGHCEYFASALATMARSLEIPTRVVLGFASGTYNPYTGMYSVLELDAHAWVEVFYGDQVGWIPADPTPSDPNQGEASESESDWKLWLEAQLDTVDSWWQNEVVNFYYNEEGPPSTSWLEEIDAFFIETLGWNWLTRPFDELLWIFAKGLGAGVGLLVLAVGYWQLQRARNQPLDLGLLRLLRGLLERLKAWLWSPRKTPPVRYNEVHALYQKWLERQARAGLPRRPRETPGAYLNRLATQNPESLPIATELTEIFLEATYAESFPAETQRRFRDLERRLG